MSKDGPIYNKFNVTRTDGSDQPGGKHEGCFLFVLDLTHDPYARGALARYINECMVTHPQLANDLLEKFFDVPRTPEEAEPDSPGWMGPGHAKLGACCPVCPAYLEPPPKLVKRNLVPPNLYTFHCEKCGAGSYGLHREDPS